MRNWQTSNPPSHQTIEYEIRDTGRRMTGQLIAVDNRDSSCQAFELKGEKLLQAYMQVPDNCVREASRIYVTRWRQAL